MKKIIMCFVVTFALVFFIGFINKYNLLNKTSEKTNNEDCYYEPPSNIWVVEPVYLTVPVRITYEYPDYQLIETVLVPKGHNVVMQVNDDTIGSISGDMYSVDIYYIKKSGEKEE